MKTVGILLCYYPEYTDNACAYFSKFVKSIDNNATLYLVNNNNTTPLSKKNHSEFIHLRGNNNCWEFSGWNEAIIALINTNPIDDNDTIIFANDTFCHHRFMTLLDNFILAKSFKKISQQITPVISGRLDSFGDLFSILGMQSNGWISTYLFATNGIFIKKIKKLSLPEGGLENCINISDKNINWGSGVSSNLENHITNWINNDWYNSQSLKNKNIDFLIGKIRSILTEKFISAYCRNEGGVLIDAYANHRIVLIMESVAWNIWSRILNLKKKIRQ